MSAREQLKPGSFYWAIPANDPDIDQRWVNEPQPARFVGLNADGEEIWFWLGVEGGSADGSSAWPSIWIGPEIKLTS